MSPGVGFVTQCYQWAVMDYRLVSVGACDKHACVAFKDGIQVKREIRGLNASEST